MSINIKRALLLYNQIGLFDNCLKSFKCSQFKMIHVYRTGRFFPQFCTTLIHNDIDIDIGMILKNIAMQGKYHHVIYQIPNFSDLEYP